MSSNQGTASIMMREEPRELASMDAIDLILLLALLPLNWVLFFLVVAQWFVRRNPALLEGLLRYVGGEHLLTNPVAAEYLPGLRNVAIASVPASPQQQERDTQAMLTRLLNQPAAVPVPSIPAPSPSHEASPPLPFTDWRKRVLAAHNVIVVGVPQSGKSTLTRAFLPALAKVGQICIIDPHDQANDWPWQAIGSGRDYAAIGQALADLTDEMTRRYQQRGAHTPLNVVIDEVPSITLHCKRDWETHYPQLVFEGAKAGIKTWVLTQSGQVRPLGLEGKGDLRSSLTWLYLGEQAIERCPACAAQAYPAAIEHRGEVRPIDTSPLPVYARLPVAEQAQWVWQPIAKDDEGALAQEPGFPTPGNPETDISASEWAETISALPFSVPEIARLGALLLAGKRKTEIVQAMPGYSGRKHRIYCAYYATLVQVIGAHPAADDDSADDE